MDSVGSRLKHAREKKGLIQKVVAQKLGISNGGLSGYERDYRDPDPDMLRKLADMYEVSVDWIVGRTKNPGEVLDEPSRALIDSLELTDEEIIENIQFTVDGEELPPQMIKDFLAYVRMSRAKK